MSTLKYTSKEHGTDIEYVVTGTNGSMTTLHPVNCTWVALELSEEEFSELEVCGELSEEEKKQDFTKNDLYA